MNCGLLVVATLIYLSVLSATNDDTEPLIKPGRYTRVRPDGKTNPVSIVKGYNGILYVVGSDNTGPLIDFESDQFIPAT